MLVRAANKKDCLHPAIIASFSTCIRVQKQPCRYLPSSVEHAKGKLSQPLPTQRRIHHQKQRLYKLSWQFRREIRCGSFLVEALSLKYLRFICS